MYTTEQSKLSVVWLAWDRLLWVFLYPPLPYPEALVPSYEDIKQYQ